MTLLLAIESSGAACSVTLRDGAVSLASRRAAMERGHAAALPPMIDEVLRTAGVEARALDAVAVSVGPGSFTGLRIGLAAAKGLGLAIDRPVIGVSCFDVAAHAAGTAAEGGWDLMVLALESRRAELFVEARAPDGSVRIPSQNLAPRDIAVQTLERVDGDGVLLLAGEAAGKVADAVAEIGSTGGQAIGGQAGAPDVRLGAAEPLDAKTVADLALVRLAADEAGGGFDAGAGIDYLRAPDAKLPSGAAGRKSP